MVEGGLRCPQGCFGLALSLLSGTFLRVQNCYRRSGYRLRVIQDRPEVLERHVAADAVSVTRPAGAMVRNLAANVPRGPRGSAWSCPSGDDCLTLACREKRRACALLPCRRLARRIGVHTGENAPLARACFQAVLRPGQILSEIRALCASSSEPTGPALAPSAGRQIMRSMAAWSRSGR